MKPEEMTISGLDKVLENQLKNRSEATGEYGYWGWQSEIDGTEAEIKRLRKKHVEFLYKRFGYNSIKIELDRLKKIEETEKALVELKSK